MAESKRDRMIRLTKQPDTIRNICTSAHIHHGKTAFTDNLLAAAGLMKEQSAGDLDKGMATWQHADEQERLMTVDAANTSMVHEFNGKEFLINLIDTPGHVDFGGNVTRAMRAIDGTVVLVCACEGIMPQTETVLKQAIRERVKPVLFINKVDRLIKELKLEPAQIQERLTKIIVSFNQFVEELAEKEFKEKWKVNAANGSVAFGSARDNWALSIPYMQKNNVTFKHIIDMYDMTKDDREKWVWEHAPLHEVILDMVIKHLPDPKVAQKYRIPKIWRGEMDSDFARDLIACDPKGKLAFVVTRILQDLKSKREIAAGRIFSGVIKEGMTVHMNLGKTNQRIQNVFMYQGIKPEMVGEVPAGNVLAIAGIQTFAGETITLEPEEPFEELKHIFEPVITKAIKPERPQDLPKLVDVLRMVGKEDPSVKIEINQETSEILMHGMGELHLEIIENRIVTEKNVQIKASPPIVVYRESITKNGQETEGKSPNKHNKLYFIVEPLEEEIYDAIKKGELPQGRLKKKDMDIRDKLVELGWTAKYAVKVKDIYNGNMFIDETRGIVQINEIIEMVLDMFEDVMNGGPTAKEPCMKVKVKLMDAKLHEDAIHRGPAQMYPAVRQGIRGSMMTANPVMYEPLQVLQIEGPNEFMGEISKLVGNKRGQLLNMEQKGTDVIVRAKIPVAEMIGWASELRSATGGRGIFSMVDQSFERLPPELQPKVVQQIVQRKGLSEGQLGA